MVDSKKEVQKYYVKLEIGRVIGPVDAEHLKKLIRKGHIKGQEPTQKKPSKQWLSFTSYPELANVFLEAMENKGGEPQQNNDQETVAATETLHASDLIDRPQDERDEMPTLLDIQKPTPVDEPDLEKTIVTQVPAAQSGENQQDKINTAIFDPNDDSDKTKVISGRQLMKVETEKPPAPSELSKTMVLSDDAKQKQPGLFEKEEVIDEDGKPKKRLLSKTTVLILAGGLIAAVFFAQYEPPEKEDVLAAIRPRVRNYSSPAISHDFGSKGRDRVKAKLLIEDGVKLYRRHNPIDYEKASKKIIRGIVNDPSNITGKAYLAKIYMDMRNVIANDENYYTAISKLLTTNRRTKSDGIPNVFIAAKAQFLLMLELTETAKQLLTNRINRSPSWELFYWLAFALNKEGKTDQALVQITNSVKASIGRVDVRVLLLRARMLAKKNQKAQALKLYRQILREHPRFARGRLHYMMFMLANAKTQGDVEKAILAGDLITKRPNLADKKDLSNIYVTMARGFERLEKLRKARDFIRFAQVLDPTNESAEIMYYRILSQVKTKAGAYRMVLKAKQKEKLNQIEDAVNAFFRARRQAPNDPVPLILLAQLYMEQNKLNQAIKLLNRATQLRLRSQTTTRIIKFRAYYLLAKAYMKKYDLDKAEQTIKVADQVRGGKRKSKFINVFYISYMRGLLAKKRSQEKLAINYFKESLAKGNTLPEVYVKLGQHVLEESIKADDPKLSQAKKTLEEPRYELAEFYFTNALKNSPLEPDALHGMALSRFYRASPSSAITFLKNRLEKYPRSPEVLTSLALIYFRSGNKVLGDRYIRKVIESNSNYAYAYKLFGDEAKKQGDRQVTHAEKKRAYLQAIRAYNIFNDYEPYNPDGHLAAADLFFYLRDYGSAAKHYHRVLSLRKNHPGVRLRLAKITLNGNESEKAEQLIKREVALFPDSSEAHLELGKIYIAKKDLARAAQSFTRSSRLSENSFDAIKWLAYTHHLKRDYETSLALYQRAIKIEPLNAELHLRIGQVYDSMGNYDKAIEEYRNYIGLINDPLEVRKIKARITRIEKFR